MFSKEEMQQAKEIVKQKLQEAIMEIEETVREEQEKRAIIETAEKEYRTMLQKERERFEEVVEQRFQNSSLHSLNELLQEAIKKRDRETIEVILKKMSEI